MSITQWVVQQRDGMCLYGLFSKDGCEGCLDPHHIVFRSEGGKDEVENLITLCRKHHDLAQSHRITRRELFDILAQLYAYERRS